MQLIVLSYEFKTTFHTHYSHFKYLVMFFSLTSASSTFQLYISDIIHKCLDHFIVAYMNAELPPRIHSLYPNSPSETFVC